MADCSFLLHLLMQKCQIKSLSMLERIQWMKRTKPLSAPNRLDKIYIHSLFLDWLLMEFKIHSVVRLFTKLLKWERKPLQLWRAKWVNRAACIFISFNSFHMPHGLLFQCIQTEQMGRVVNELDTINFSIKKASQLVKEIGRQVCLWEALISWRNLQVKTV